MKKSPSTATKITINIDGFKGRRPLYLKYPHQHDAQPAHISMDVQGKVTAWINPDLGNGVPVEIWHKRELCWGVPNYLSGPQYRKILSDKKVLSLLERVHAGHTIDWDGNNMRGFLTDDAAEAYIDLDNYMGELSWDYEH